MGKPKRALAALASLTSTPPSTLLPTQTIAQLLKATGNNLYLVHLPPSFSSSSTSHLPDSTNAPILVELSPQFRSSVWLRRGGYIVVDTSEYTKGKGTDLRIKGEIVNVIREEKNWRKMPYWPPDFPPQSAWGEDDGSDGDGEDFKQDSDGWDKPRYSNDEDEAEENVDKENEKKDNEKK